ncbi:caspase-7-like isoform X2 [Mercenaria mercenaria]|uniref:caspase-7-like isoform X2 n=1 Tax=Mercenaria mercenaria TaxID=6596 RepID=UPI00234F4DBE|nr:caspase-7-like isoform X2 [Mercenaria mercenaria]
MADPLLAEQDEEILIEDQQDSILKTLRKYLGPDRKTFGKEDIVTNHQNTQSYSNRGSSARRETDGEIESIAPADHYKGFDITLSEQNEMVFTNTSNMFTYSSETNILEKGPATKAVNIAEQQTTAQEHMDISDIDNQYQFNHKRRGHMVLFVNNQILNDDDHRKGADEDFRKMEEIRTKFGFELLNSDMTTNLSKLAMQMVLRKAQQIDHSDCDCFAIMVSTHGQKLSSPRNRTGDIYGLSCADGQIMELSEIVKMFDDAHCPTLEGKPKLFFIQACRGNDSGGKSDTADTKARYESQSRTSVYESPSRTPRYESPSRTPRYESLSRTPRYESPSRIPRYESPSRTTRYESHLKTGRCESPSRKVKYESTSKATRFESPSRTARFKSPSSSIVATLSDDDTPYLNCCDNDMLVMFAAPPGMVAWRSEANGSWMIHHLHAVLMEYDFRKPKNLVIVLTKVCRLISQCETHVQDPKFHKKKVVSVIESKLTKDILF